jgi:hypothetical protein
LGLTPKQVRRKFATITFKRKAKMNVASAPPVGAEAENWGVRKQHFVTFTSPRRAAG